MRYRKKPVEITAIQWTGQNLDACMDFCKGNSYYELMASGNKELVILTLEDGAAEVTAKHIASVMDWIICGVAGEYYPCKPDIFERTYEPVDEEVVSDVNPPNDAPPTTGFGGYAKANASLQAHLEPIDVPGRVVEEEAIEGLATYVHASGPEEFTQLTLGNFVYALSKMDADQLIPELTQFEPFYYPGYHSNNASAIFTGKLITASEFSKRIYNILALCNDNPEKLIYVRVPDMSSIMELIGYDLVENRITVGRRCVLGG